MRPAFLQWHSLNRNVKNFFESFSTPSTNNTMWANVLRSTQWPSSTRARQKKIVKGSVSLLWKVDALEEPKGQCLCCKNKFFLEIPPPKGKGKKVILLLPLRDNETHVCIVETSWETAQAARSFGSVDASWWHESCSTSSPLFSCMFIEYSCSGRCHDSIGIGYHCLATLSHFQIRRVHHSLLLV